MKFFFMRLRARIGMLQRPLSISIEPAYRPPNPVTNWGWPLDVWAIALNFVAPRPEPQNDDGQSEDASGHQARHRLRHWSIRKSFGGFGAGPRPLSPEQFRRFGDRGYLYADRIGDRYHNVTPNQALAAGGRGIIVKLPR